CGRRPAARGGGWGSRGGGGGWARGGRGWFGGCSCFEAPSLRSGEVAELPPVRELLRLDRQTGATDRERHRISRRAQVGRRAEVERLGQVACRGVARRERGEPPAPLDELQDRCVVELAVVHRPAARPG